VPELLLELLSEEIPARMQARAADDLKRLLCERLERAQLTYERPEAFVTPRRLALVVEGLPERQPDTIDEKRGLAARSDLSALGGYLANRGVPADLHLLLELNRLQPGDGKRPLHGEHGETIDIWVKQEPRGLYFFTGKTITGRPTSELLGDLILQVLEKLSWPKSMRWGGGTFRWVRPLQNILALFEGAPIRFAHTLGEGARDCDSRALVANGRTSGHRFLAPNWFEVRDFADYKAKLYAAKVIVDQNERRRLILEEARRLAAAEGLRLREDEALLDEVTGLVEWPVVMLGRIDPAFMNVPQEVLVTAMRKHQKYFSLVDADGKLAPRFVLVANTEATDGGKAIVAGNERVLRARLSDAKFFWDEDRKRTLESRVPKLAERIFHAKLGSDYQRTIRLTQLSSEIARRFGASEQRVTWAGNAAYLCKADLTTAMVGEFPELQGVMGRYYALHDGEPPEVANAIADHYAPQGPSDRCPKAPVSVAVALADRLDTLTGFFAIGEKPTGSKDPFAIRRACLGVIRLILENSLRLELTSLLSCSFDLYLDIVGTTSDVLRHMQSVDRGQLIDDLLAFFADRLEVHLREQGVRHDLIAAVFAGGAEDDIVRLLARVDALRDFLDTEDGANLLVAYRRASNIVRIEENKDGTVYDGEAVGRLLEEQQEIELYRSLAAARASIADALAGERFGGAMAALAGLRAPVDAFFDRVTVNCANSHLRVNRLRLLSQIRSALGGVADFSQIEG
jgi:glycyl-tRNA synthetase beta chain